MDSYPDAKSRLHQVLVPKDCRLVNEHLGQDLPQEPVEIFYLPVRSGMVRGRNPMLRGEKRRICFHHVPCEVSTIV